MEVDQTFSTSLRLMPRFWWQSLRAAWCELFVAGPWGLRRYLETPVRLCDADGHPVGTYVAELHRPLQTSEEDRCYSAYLLPGEWVLLRTFDLPKALEVELGSAIALEVQARSPFVLADTCYGWSIVQRHRDSIRVVVAISAISKVMRWLRSTGAIDDPTALPEVWCFASGGEAVVLQGFGEGRRRSDYRRRLAWLALLAACLLMFLVGLFSLPGLMRHWQADLLEARFGDVRQRASTALELRRQLSSDNTRLAALQKFVDEQVDFRQVLDHLSVVTPDDVYLQFFRMEGRVIRLRGQANSAASYMQLLSRDDHYSDVRAPSGIRRDLRSGLEQFALEMHLTTGVARQ